MLQLPHFYQKCNALFHQQKLKQTPAADIQTHIANLMALVMTEKNNYIQSNTFLSNYNYKLDQYLWTNEIEYIDKDDFPDTDKQKIADALHKKNAMFGTYNIMFNIILPFIRDVNQQENRPCKILEIAGGSGQLALFLANKSKLLSLSVEITSSDIVGYYAIELEKKTHKNNALVTFKQIDALSLDKRPKGEYDLILNLHSLHHFSPEQLATLFYGSELIVNKAFVAIDAYRGLRNLLFIGGSAIIQSMTTLNLMYAHDAWLSARKMYPQKLLEMIANIACPNGHVHVTHPSIGLTALIIEPSA